MRGTRAYQNSTNSAFERLDISPANTAVLIGQISSNLPTTGSDTNVTPSWETW
jgi:hypothetical protein